MIPPAMSRYLAPHLSNNEVTSIPGGTLLISMDIGVIYCQSLAYLPQTIFGMPGFVTEILTDSFANTIYLFDSSVITLEHQIKPYNKGVMMTDYSALDDKDVEILRVIQQDCSLSNVDLARQVGLSPPTIHSRLKRLRQLGYVEQEVARLNRKKLGFGIECFVQVSVDIHTKKTFDGFLERIKLLPQVLECHVVTGEYDCILKVVVRDQDELYHFLTDKLQIMETIERMQTSIVLSTAKDTTQLPLLVAEE